MTGNRVKTQGSNVDLTLQSIHGINSKMNPYDVTAAVSFTGSASNMQVSSFTMCGRTGNLLVESNVLEVAKEEGANDASNEVVRKSSEVSLFATFNDPIKGRRSLPSSGTSTSSNSSSRPHLKLKLSESNPNVPKGTLSNINRTSAIKQNPSLVEEGHSIKSSDGSRGPSIQWEGGGEAMPDIVELHISMRTSEHTLCHEGIAHLVFYGSKRELGVTTMDLRIKQKQPLHPDSPSDPNNIFISFAEDAYIRVQVEITPDDHPAPAPEEIILSDHFDEQKIGSIMTKLNEHEEMAAARAKAHKMTFEKHDELGKNVSRRIFCNGLDFGETFRAVVDVFTKCEGKKRRRNNRKGFFPVLRATSTMESTIETRDSMQL